MLIHKPNGTVVIDLIKSNVSKTVKGNEDNKIHGVYSVLTKRGIFKRVNAGLDGIRRGKILIVINEHMLVMIKVHEFKCEDGVFSVAGVPVDNKKYILDKIKRQTRNTTLSPYWENNSRTGLYAQVSVRHLKLKGLLHLLRSDTAIAVKPNNFPPAELRGTDLYITDVENKTHHYLNLTVLMARMKEDDSGMIREASIMEHDTDKLDTSSEPLKMIT